MGDINLLLVGKTGHGKSSTGNSILDRDEFKVAVRTTSTTFRLDIAYDQVDGRTVKIVDTPGVTETNYSELKTVQHVKGELKEAMKPVIGGYNAIIFVMRYGVAFTAEEKRAIENLKALLGESVLNKFGILVMTHGDQFQGSQEQFQYWCRQHGGHFLDLVKECNERMVLFNNNETDPDHKKKQRLQLFSLVDQINSRYTEKHFAEAKQSRKQLVIGLQKPEIEREVAAKLNDLKIKTHEAKNASKSNALILLRDVKTRLQVLLETVEEKDQGTKILADIIQKIIWKNVKLEEKIKKADNCRIL